MNKYKTGQIPQIGDIVKVSPNHTLSYYSSLRHALNTGAKFKVINVVQGTKSLLVKLENVEKNKAYDLVNFMKASHFKLVQAAGTNSTPTKAVKYLIVKNGKIADTAGDDLTERLQKLMAKDYTQEFDVYTYDSTVGTKKPEVVVTRKTV